ncbi:response regulator [Candidatus Nitrospira bockiana]
MARILVIDDEPVFLQALTEAAELRKGDFGVETATSAEDGLRLLQQQDYDVVISDIRMPGLDGIEFLRKAREVRPDTPVVLITGFGDPRLEERALRMGAYAFIHKPFVVDVFFSVVSRALLRSKLLRRPPPEHFDPVTVSGFKSAKS